MERYTETCPCCIDCVEKTNKHLLYRCPGSQQVWHAKDPPPSMVMRAEYKNSRVGPHTNKETNKNHLFIKCYT